MAGYVKIERKILDWEWYKDTNTKSLFLHMILTAEWSNEPPKSARGTLVSSIRSLSEETGLTVAQVRTALSHLETTGEVSYERKGNATEYTVNKYNLYQLTKEKGDIFQKKSKDRDKWNKFNNFN